MTEWWKMPPNIFAILPKFMDFCGAPSRVAHNADFDTGFIRHNCGEVLGPASMITISMWIHWGLPEAF